MQKTHLSVLLAAILALFLVGCGGKAEPSAPSAPEAPETSSGSAPSSGKAEDTPEEALAAATDYLTFMHLSREGMIEELTNYGFSRENAEYAADNCGADWNE